MHVSILTAGTLGLLVGPALGELVLVVDGLLWMVRLDFSFICQVTHLSYPSLCPRLWWFHLNSLNRQGGSNHGAVVLPGRGWNSEVCL